MKPSNIRCPTPKCRNTVEKYGKVDMRVYETTLRPKFMPDATHQCESCGGYFNGKEWKHVCSKCGKVVKPGELVGLFVPHFCKECLQEIVKEQVKNHQICSVCHEPYALCCC